MDSQAELNSNLKERLAMGGVIPAHPLALNPDRSLDELSQKLLTRYYLASGASGLAVGVHTTQFAIRDPRHGLYSRVLELAVKVADRSGGPNRPIMIAGVSGPTESALEEAELARSLGYDLVLVSLNGLQGWSEEDLLDRARQIGQIMPLFGFYLQPAVGGKVLSFDYWREFADIPSVAAIKIAPFDRYQTLDVVRAVCHSSRQKEVVLYTGNDDNIVNDLLTTYTIPLESGEIVSKEIAGGLLGHWAVWTQKAVELVSAIRHFKSTGEPIPLRMLSLAQKVTDTNAAFFDAANHFKGCIAGIHEVLRRQGLIQGIWCLDPEEGLSAGQEAEIDRVYLTYPELNDDQFVQQNIQEWRKEVENLP